MKNRGTPYEGYSQEREDRLDQIELKAMRVMFGNPNMTVQEMKEMRKPKDDNTIKVTFLKKMPLAPAEKPPLKQRPYADL